VPTQSTAGYPGEWWPTYKMDSQRYLDIGMTKSTVHERFAPTRMHLWNDVIPHMKSLFSKHQAQQQEHQTPPPIPDIPIGK